MATYEKNTWNNGDLITAEKMNKIENQLEIVTPGATNVAPIYTAKKYEIGDYCIYNGILYRCTANNASTPPTGWVAVNAMSEVENGIKSIDAKVESAVTPVKEDVNQLSESITEIKDGKTEQQDYHYDASFTGGIGENIYESNVKIIPKGTVIEKVKYFAPYSDSNATYLILLNSDNVIVDKIGLNPLVNQWNVTAINKSYDVETHIAITGGGIGYSYTTGSRENYFSDGFREANGTEYREKQIGESISFNQTTPADRHYQFSIELVLHEMGLSEIIEKNITELDSRVNTIEGKYDLHDYTMPKMYATTEEGYTLLGRWYGFNTEYKRCVNSAGSSIMFKTKKCDSVNIDIVEVVHPSHPEWKMSVSPYIAVSIDGDTFNRYQIGTSPISITLPNADEHLLWIVIDGMCLHSGSANRNSGWSAVNLNSITPSSGKIYKVIPSSKQMLFIGDSIVEGINTLGITSTSEANSTVNEFSFKTARKLNSIPLIQGYGGSTSKNGLNYERYSWVDAKDNSFIVNNEVDVVLIEYGFNDLSAGYSAEEFKGYYNELIDLLIGHYTGVPIICMIPFKQSFAKEIREIASSRQYCYCIETLNYNVSYSDNSHPSAEGAESIAKSLSEDIIELFGKGYFMS